MNVLLRERAQPLLVTAPSLEDTVGVPHASVAEAEPRAPFISPVVGLHPSASALPVAVMVGAVTSAVHVAVREAVAVLPQPPVAVNVLVLARLHPMLSVGPSLDVIVTLAQTSVAVIVPKAALMSLSDGLHPRGVG